MIPYPVIIGAIIGAVIGGLIGGLLMRRKMQPKLDLLAQKNSELDKTVAQLIYKKPGRRPLEVKKGEFDPTKHMSLQPSNRKPLAAEFQQVKEGDGEFKIEQQGSFVQQMPKADYTYRFFGSQLSLGDSVLISGLQRKMHQLEITKDDQVYIGGVEHKINPSAVEQLKRVIAKAEKSAEV